MARTSTVIADLAALTAMDRQPPKQQVQMPCCDTCAHFERDPINPAAGVGFCGVGHGGHFPGARHWCADHRVNA